MAPWNVSRRISRAVWTLLALCLPVLLHAGPPEVSKFISSERQAYLEVKADDGLHKIYTEHRGEYKAMFVFGERDNPELIELSFLDAGKRITTYILEFRTEKDRVSLGLQFADHELIRSLKSDAKGFEDWRDRFSTFPDRVTGSAVLTDPSFADPTGVRILDGDTIVFRASDYFCFCRNGGLAAACIISALRCAMDNLCTVWECIESGEWSPSCHDALEEAKACLGMVE
jgi:hypothetical protein